MAVRSYSVGERVIHQVFGDGLVVDVRTRDFFDILEIAFSDGVRKVTSIHPQLRHDCEEEIHPEEESLGAAQPLDADETREESPAQSTESPAVAPARRLELGSQLDPGNFSFERSPILQVDRLSFDPHLKPKAPEPGRAVDLTFHLKALRIARQRGFEQLLALNHAQDVQRLEHQIRACLRVLREMKGRALLADEVGLGKTIEAGLILKEYLLRALVRKVLILTPASLLTQWREELTHKFGIEARVYTRGDPWNRHPILIGSLDTAKSPKNRRAIAEAGFDILIVDEAHRLRNHLTQAWKFIDSLSLKYLLLLTATPVQNDLRELYNLITLLRPGMLGTYRSFRQEFVVRGDRRLPKNTRVLSQMLADVMIRTTRSSTSIQFPRRDVNTCAVELSSGEQAFYTQVSDFIRRAAQGEEKLRRQIPWPLLLMVLQKEIGSSTSAALGTLRKAASGRLASSSQDLQELVRVGENVKEHSKLIGLLDLVAGCRKEGEKTLIFSQFRRTVEFLGQELRKRGHRVGLFHGSLTAGAKDAIVNGFRNDLDVMISTEAGGEGRNLQFCRTVVNYDLPWNPMRVEQRIGRVHRIGQTRDVRIFNLAARGTLESYVLEILQKKINMFHLVIGEMEQILGNLDWSETFETRVFSAWTGSSSPKELENSFGEMGSELQMARERYEHVKTYDQEVFAVADGGNSQQRM